MTAPAEMLALLQAAGGEAREEAAAVSLASPSRGGASETWKTGRSRLLAACQEGAAHTMASDPRRAGSRVLDRSLVAFGSGSRDPHAPLANRLPRSPRVGRLLLLLLLLPRRKKNVCSAVARGASADLPTVHTHTGNADALARRGAKLYMYARIAVRGDDGGASAMRHPSPWPL